MFDKKTKNQKNIPHCHFTKIDLNEKITFLYCLPGFLGARFTGTKKI